LFEGMFDGNSDENPVGASVFIWTDGPPLRVSVGIKDGDWIGDKVSVSVLVYRMIPFQVLEPSIHLKFFPKPEPTSNRMSAFDMNTLPTLSLLTLYTIVPVDTIVT